MRWGIFRSDGAGGWVIGSGCSVGSGGQVVGWLVVELVVR